MSRGGVCWRGTEQKCLHACHCCPSRMLPMCVCMLVFSSRTSAPPPHPSQPHPIPKWVASLERKTFWESVLGSHFLSAAWPPYIITLLAHYRLSRVFGQSRGHQDTCEASDRHAEGTVSLRDGQGVAGRQHTSQGTKKNLLLLTFSCGWHQKLLFQFDVMILSQNLKQADLT